MVRIFIFLISFILMTCCVYASECNYAVLSTQRFLGQSCTNTCYPGTICYMGKCMDVGLGIKALLNNPCVPETRGGQPGQCLFWYTPQYDLDTSPMKSFNVGLVCSNTTSLCVPLRRSGEACESQNQCMDGMCVNNVCQSQDITGDTNVATMDICNDAYGLLAACDIKNCQAGSTGYLQRLSFLDKGGCLYQNCHKERDNLNICYAQQAKCMNQTVPTIPDTLDSYLLVVPSNNSEGNIDLYGVFRVILILSIILLIL